MWEKKTQFNDFWTYCWQWKEFVSLNNKMDFMEIAFSEIKEIIKTHNDNMFNKLIHIEDKLQALDTKFIRLDIYNEKEKTFEKRLNDIEWNLTWIVRLIIWIVISGVLTLLYKIK